MLVFAATPTLLPATAQAQGAIEAWVQRYNGPGNGGDSAGDVAVDTSGNVYVTGRTYGGDPLYGGSGDDSTTIKYSSAGVPVWTNSYSGPGSGQEYTRAVGVDNSGNVFVTGVAIDVNGEGHCATLKYSSAGMPLWTNLYTATGSLGVALVVDPSGNVVVMGSLWQSGNGDYLTLKYSSAGVLLWAGQYNGPGAGYDMANAVAVDGNGNVLVTGASPGSDGVNDYATIKYSSAGAQLWVKRYNGAVANYDDQAKAVAVDGNGNVFVTGLSQDSSGFSDYATIKYSSAGVPLWTNRYNGPGNGGDAARAIAVGASGDVYVSGVASGSLFATLKYSSAGVPLWTNLYDGPTSGYGGVSAMAVDSAGNAYITGYSEGIGSDFDCVTIAYSSSGVPLWTNRYNGPANGRDGANAVAVDANGDVYVTGYSGGRSGSGDDYARADWVTVKYVTPPIITRQPLSLTNATGTTASFTVEAVGGTPLSYQWCKDGTNLVNGGNLSGVTTTNLVIANVQLADAADYTVVVTNAYGSITSQVAQLTVTIPPSPGRFSNLLYSPATGFSFIFREATPGQLYRIQRSSSLAEVSWTDWLNFTYSEPIALTDIGATGMERRFYRAITP